MKHIRYISDNATICDKPDQMGTDFVVLDYAPDDIQSCGMCLELLTVHNKKAYEREQYESLSIVRNPPVELVPPPTPVQSFVIGLLVSSAFWLGALLAYLLWFR